ncbi:MAG: NTP transferase domain-containing protein [Phycisphaerae bacterium]|nr:NTP transferase domain-containing protein [Phycisphaerae bacterium]
MKPPQLGPTPSSRSLRDAVALSPDKILNPQGLALHGGFITESPVLVILAAGKGTRFGKDPKCIQPVHGTPLARHSIDAFGRVSPSPVICLVGYRHEDVSAALGPDNVYVRSDNPAGGTAFAAYEAFSVAELQQADPLLIITMGDRIVPPSVFRRLWDTHRAGGAEADLTFLSARYEPPKNRGKGRVLRGDNGRVLRILEERDIAAEADGPARQALLDLTEGNCPLYAIRATRLLRHLQSLTNDNAQGQYYLTDVVEAISRAGGDIRTITTTPADPEYDLLCSDVTQPMDLALLEGMLASARGLLFPEELEVDAAARAIAADRPPGQVASITRQLQELAAAVLKERLAFRPDQPVGIGIAGGRLRIAFMHPDMVRFFGPAWQMPIGAGNAAGNAAGNEQIVVLAQEADDRRIHLYPMTPEYRESINYIPSDDDVMYPGEGISDLHAYEAFGTRMSESVLLSLGYFSDEELEQRRKKGLPLPPPSLWVSSNMRRPFALVGNAIASMRTLRTGNLGAKVQECLGRDHFRGLRLVSTGNIPQGGFSSSSAVTVAVKNAMNGLFDLGVPPDLLVHLACQAEYGTGVRAGSLDQATIQKGRAGQGALISSNPRDNYRIMGTYPVPTDRFRILFPYSVERDRAAWRWSWGAYGEGTGPGPLTAGEMRKMTGKAAELAAILLKLPLDTDLFHPIEGDLLEDGRLSRDSRAWICSVLRRLPLLAPQEDLRRQVDARREWYVAQLAETLRLDPPEARAKADAALESLFAGWRNPVLRRTTASGAVVEEQGVPLRAMVAYLFGEMAKNFHLLHHPDEWIDCVTRSQCGDRSVDIDPDRLPSWAEMETEQPWERDAAGPARLNRWLEQFGASPVDFNRGLDDESLSEHDPPAFERLEGSGFFRGLALIDLAEAMLKRAFGCDAVAVRVNAAGQGDYFQVHVDAQRAAPDDVKQFIRAAFYRRFGLAPVPEFVELHPGGGAVGLRLSRYDVLPQLIRHLQASTA